MNIYMIKTNKECFVTDCEVFGGYDYEYHKTELTNLHFDGERTEETYCKNWYVIKKYPEKIETEFIEETNKRYELDNKNMECEKFPKIIKEEDIDKFDFNICEFYTFKSDKLPTKLVEVENINIEIIMELDNFKMPNKIEYDYLDNEGRYSDGSIYKITNADVKHQFLDKIIFPEIMLSSRPCMLNSKQMFDITRQYIKENIDFSIAQIAKDTVECFEVKKIIKLLEPEFLSYKNLFSKTREDKINYKTEYKYISIFSIAHNKTYTTIEAMYANSENELKEKVDTWLKKVIDIINKPLALCPCCNGTGYMENI